MKKGTLRRRWTLEKIVETNTNAQLRRLCSKNQMNTKPNIKWNHKESISCVRNLIEKSHDIRGIKCDSRKVCLLNCWMFKEKRYKIYIYIINAESQCPHCVFFVRGTASHHSHQDDDCLKLKNYTYTVCYIRCGMLQHLDFPRDLNLGFLRPWL